MAAYRGHPQVVQLLLDRGAQVDPPAQSVQYGGTPLAAAAAGLSSARGPHHLAVMHALLAKGAQVERTVEVTGLTPLYIAAAQMSAGSMGSPSCLLAGVQLLLQQGADLQAVLDMAARKQQTQLHATLLLAVAPPLPPAPPLAHA